MKTPPLEVEVIGRLHFKVGSRTRHGHVHLVDLEPQEDIPHFCSCEHHERTNARCQHLRAAIRFAKGKNE